MLLPKPKGPTPQIDFVQAVAPSLDLVEDIDIVEDEIKAEFPNFSIGSDLTASFEAWLFCES